jgi:hypothetical protein
MLTVDSEFTASNAMTILQRVFASDNNRRRIVWDMENVSWNQTFAIRDAITAAEKFYGSRISEHVFAVPSVWWRVWLRGILYSSGIVRPLAIVLSGSLTFRPEGTYAMV